MDNFDRWCLSGPDFDEVQEFIIEMAKMDRMLVEAIAVKFLNKKESKS